MKSGFAVCGAFLAGAALTLVIAAPWQDAKAKDKPSGQPGGPPAGMSADEMAAMMKAGTPGPEQKAMEGMVGKWSVDMEWIMAPGAAPEKSSGTSEFKMIMGGRYLVEETSSTSSMGPFHGMGISAFNNATGKYEHVWLDDMSTGMMYSTGEGKGDTIEYKGDMFDPAKKAMCSTRFLVHKTSDSARDMEMYCSYSGQPEFKCMTLKYTKAAAGAR